jgi:hypothetical protein
MRIELAEILFLASTIDGARRCRRRGNKDGVAVGVVGKRLLLAG